MKMSQYWNRRAAKSGISPVLVDLARRLALRPRLAHGIGATLFIAAWISVSGCSGAHGGAADGAKTARGPIIVLAGGGGDEDASPATDQKTWSTRLFRHMLDNGDVTGDKKFILVTVARVASEGWPATYWKALGADNCIELVIGTTEEADAATLDAAFENADAVFIKGGDQGKYYDLWNERRLERGIRRVYDRGGAIGGTSAGAMSLAQYALAGSTSVQSAEVLQDAHHKILDDESDHGSAIHTDFLSFVPDAFVDTHVTQRARLGRMCGVLARAIEDFKQPNLYAIGLDQKTGVFICNGVAEVVGNGAVDLIRPTADSTLIRRAGAPLVWTELAFDRLTEGFRFTLADRAVDMKKPPIGTFLLDWRGGFKPEARSWEVRGDTISDETHFNFTIDRVSKVFELTKARRGQFLPQTFGMVRSHLTDTRGRCTELFFRGLYEVVGFTGFMLDDAGRVWADADHPTIVHFGANPESNKPEVATLVVVSRDARARCLAPVVSSYDNGGGTLNAAAIVGMKLHVLADSKTNGFSFDVLSARVVRDK